MKEKFCIFLDIDGDLIYWHFIIKKINSGEIRKGRIIKDFDQHCVQSLNLLISSLSDFYDVDLVISSSWRLLHFEDCISALYKNGLEYKNNINKTPYINNERNVEILSYLKDKKCDYVVIDDEISKLSSIPKDKIIHTKDKKLTINLVMKYLEESNIHCF